MIYVFYTLMGISAFFTILSAISVVLKVITGTVQNPFEPALMEFLLSACLFCLAAMCVQLWEGFPSI